MLFSTSTDPKTVRVVSKITYRPEDSLWIFVLQVIADPSGSKPDVDTHQRLFSEMPMPEILDNWIFTTCPGSAQFKQGVFEETLLKLGKLVSSINVVVVDVHDYRVFFGTFRGSTSLSVICLLRDSKESPFFSEFFRLESADGERWTRSEFEEILLRHEIEPENALKILDEIIKNNPDAFAPETDSTPIPQLS